MTLSKVLFYARSFKIPLLVTLSLPLYIILSYLNLSSLAVFLALASIILGSYKLVIETLSDIKKGQFGLDYIAILAITFSVVAHEYIVGIILALMLASGRNLEEFASTSAKKSLTALTERIPHDISVEKNGIITSKEVTSIKIGEIIIVRKGEVIPLDGTLQSVAGIVDESSLTGEAFPVDKFKGDMLRSGIVNVGDTIRILVIKEEKDSTYKKIVGLVERAQQGKAPFVRLANKYSIYFTIITFIIAAFAYFLRPGFESILAVLVVATPCPLILATPIALMGGMNAQAKKRIIIKKLAVIEMLSRIDTIVFDKTGTITLGRPKVVDFTLKDNSIQKTKILSVASALERNSLHPLAKAIVEYAKNAPVLPSTDVSEKVGKGITGTVNGKTYTLKKLKENDTSEMKIALYKKDKVLAVFVFEDEVRNESKEIINKLKALQMDIKIFTGDTKKTAEALVKKMGLAIEVRAGLSPEEKQIGIEELKKDGRRVVMVGDGINDAPALALADVGIVFATEEQTAASVASDIVILNGNFSSVLYSILSSRRTISIAKQSIIAGIGMSVICMVAASLGLIPPLLGAIIQEGIDVAVIINALRASKF